MVERVGINTERVLRGADLFKTLCERSGINVPPLQKILGVLVSTKLCPANWQTIVSRAYPQDARNFVYHIETYPDRAEASRLTETPSDALHILGMANLSAEAPVSGLYQQFCTEMEMSQSATSQLMFFALGSLDTQKHTIWGSDFMTKITSLSTESIRKTLLPRIEGFVAVTEPRILHENYALLLSGMSFDLDRLDKQKLQASAFPCQLPPVARVSKQHLWVKLYSAVNSLKQLRVNVNERTVPPTDIKLAEELIHFVDTADYSQQPKQLLRDHNEMATVLQTQFSEKQMTEEELRQRSRKEIDRLNTAIAFARQRADEVKMKNAGT